MKAIEAIINGKFKVTLDSGVPPKWVGMDLLHEQDALHVSSASTFLAYDIPKTRFSLKLLNELE